MLLSAAVSDKEENLDKKQLELLYRNDRYVYVCVSTYCVHFFPIAITGDSQYVAISLSLPNLPWTLPINTLTFTSEEFDWDNMRLAAYFN